MISVKGIYDGKTIILDNTPVTYKCEVIVTFMEPSVSGESADDGSLAYLFKDYFDDGIRELIVDFGESIGNEQW